jgi:hypothetical protein
MTPKRIKRHAAIDEERFALDVIRLVAGQPHRGTPDFLRFADALVRDQFEQFIVVLGCVPGLHIDRSADRARCQSSSRGYGTARPS